MFVFAVGFADVGGSYRAALALRRVWAILCGIKLITRKYTLGSSPQNLKVNLKRMTIRQQQHLTEADEGTGATATKEAVTTTGQGNEATELKLIQTSCGNTAGRLGGSASHIPISLSCLRGLHQLAELQLRREMRLINDNISKLSTVRPRKERRDSRGSS